ncbi:uncharacterized protein [Pyrus communis]|uniref:uncharacterized protein n=1 Tax=Pyrus communis TaxID=23211 RepID=UPI0035C1726F
MTTTTQTDIERFIWKNIICRFGIPHSIVTNNGPPFVGKDLAKFFEKYGIKHHMSTPWYLQGNGQAKASNKIIFDCLKKTLSNNKDKWPNELPGVLWVIIPPNVVVPNISTVLPNFKQNEKEMAINLDLAKEEREKVITRITAYQQQLHSNYNKRAKIWQF